jgi:hypothetical protein
VTRHLEAEAAPCVHLRPIAGQTNEVGSMVPLLDELAAAYGRCRLVQVVTTDAGNTSLEAASRVVALDWDDFCQFKSEHGELHTEALRVLGQRRAHQADASYHDTQNGRVVSVLRMIALAILAVARRLTRFAHTRETPSWAQVAEHFLIQLCGSILQTAAFDLP